MRKCLTLIIVFVFVALVLLSGRDGNAMPGFARKYKMSCQVCHAPVPRLKPYGAEFAGNGFKLTEGEPERPYIDTGDDLLLLARDFPLGMRIDIYGTHYAEDKKSCILVDFFDLESY